MPLKVKRERIRVMPGRPREPRPLKWFAIVLFVLCCAWLVYMIGSEKGWW